MSFKKKLATPAHTPTGLTPDSFRLNQTEHARTPSPLSVSSATEATSIDEVSYDTLIDSVATALMGFSNTKHQQLEVLGAHYQFSMQVISTSSAPQPPVPTDDSLSAAISTIKNKFGRINAMVGLIKTALRNDITIPNQSPGIGQLQLFQQFTNHIDQLLAQKKNDGTFEISDDIRQYINPMNNTIKDCISDCSIMIELLRTNHQQAEYIKVLEELKNELAPIFDPNPNGVKDLLAIMLPEHLEQFVRQQNDSQHQK